MVIEKKASPVASLLKNDSSAIKTLKVGDFAEGKLIKKGKKIAYFDLGALGTGVVFGAEYTNASEIIKGLAIGDSISGKVVDTENENGYAEISLTDASKQKNWQQLKDIQDTDDAMTVKITGANSGGLLAEIAGIKAFLPVSQLSNEHYPRVDDGSKEKILEELKKLVGSDLKVKIITNNPGANKLIISEREVSDMSVKELLKKYKVGDTVEGIVSGVADFGVFVRFVDQPGIEGLVHISELDHRLIDHPKEVVKINDAVRTKVVEIKDGRVSLSIKALKPNPWDTIGETYKTGQEIKGVISRFNPFGAFVALDKEIQGLIHVSEFGSVDEMKKQLAVSETYAFRIESMKPEEKRIILKLVK